MKELNVDEFLRELESEDKQTSQDKAEEELENLYEDNGILQMFVEAYKTSDIKEIQKKIIDKCKAIYEKFPELEPEPDNPYYF